MRCFSSSLMGFIESPSALHPTTNAVDDELSRNSVVLAEQRRYRPRVIVHHCRQRSIVQCTMEPRRMQGIVEMVARRVGIMQCSLIRCERRWNRTIHGARLAVDVYVAVAIQIDDRAIFVTAHRMLEFVQRGYGSFIHVNRRRA